MSSILVFNPDTDYALASGRRYYTPPAHVSLLKKRLELLPALYAHPGDIILVEDKANLSIPQDLENLENLEKLEKLESLAGRGVAIMDYTEARSNSEIWRTHKPAPWGWNLSIRQFFLDISGGRATVTSEERIERLRELSHRRTTIKFLSLMPEEMRTGISLPTEITDPEVAVKAFENGMPLYFKAPWSSSGRGVILTDDLERKHVEPWVRGIIRRQGSVMMEKAYVRALDFATEWMCEDGKAAFLGLSVFNTSRRGKYHGNVQASQEELNKLISNHIRIDIGDMVQPQKEALETLIAPEYDGPLGIDMLATTEGDVHPCVEINLRHTMGMIGLF